MKILSKNQIVRTIWDKRYLKVFSFSVEDKGKFFSREYVQTPDSVAAIVHNTDENTFVFVEQFRVGLAGRNFEINEDFNLIELVAGHIDVVDGVLESPEIAIKREIYQETGYDVDSLELLIQPYYTSPGFSTETIAIYYARVSNKSGKGGGCESENENIKVIEMPEDDAYSYNFKDGKTIMALDRLILRSVNPFAGMNMRGLI